MLMVVAALGVTLISFVISHAVPADPIVSNLGQQASQRPEIVAAFKQRWGLDRPLHEQYLAFLGNLAHGDLGTSINTRRPIMTDVSQFLPATVVSLGVTTTSRWSAACGIPSTWMETCGVSSEYEQAAVISATRKSRTPAARARIHVCVWKRP